MVISEVKSISLSFANRDSSITLLTKVVDSVTNEVVLCGVVVVVDGSVTLKLVVAIVVDGVDFVVVDVDVEAVVE
jgi:hypothetical protein